MKKNLIFNGVLAKTGNHYKQHETIKYYSKFHTDVCQSETMHEKLVFVDNVK